jgi:choline dehydrogenase-like flavoprotein
MEVVIDNPNVGENLQDHAVVPISFEVNDGVQTAEPMLRDPKIFEALMEMYTKDRSGLLGQFFAASPTDDVALDLLCQPDGASGYYFLVKTQLNIENYSKIGEWMTPKTAGNFFILMLCLNFPFLRGNIHISSPSPTHPPTIDPGYLSHPMDLSLAALHLQFFSTIINTPPLSHLFKEGGARIPAHAFPNSQPPTLEEAKELVRETLISNYHPMGTCMIGPVGVGVVDSWLIVHGTRHLRAVDASVFPVMPEGVPITGLRKGRRI